MKIYTRTGDDGTTGLYFGGRVAKDGDRPAAYGDVDESQAAIGVAQLEQLPAYLAAIGVARALASGHAELADFLLGVQRDLWVLMAELATADDNRHKLEGGSTRVTSEMVASLERLIDEISAGFDPPTEFVVPGGSVIGAQLDVARCVVRRAERTAIKVAAADSFVVPYLNRLSDLLWTMARWQDGHSLVVRDVAAPL